ncbi:MAG: TraE family protein, partial [Clostridiales bacterium]|nr:TraE family protein [Clostridiales bacterium]
MIRSIKTIMRQDREPYRVPRRVQDVIPIQCVWPDGIFKVGIKFSKTYRFTDINYKVAGQEDKETMFRVYSELLNSLDCAATTKLTICNRRQSQADFEQSVL